MTARGCAESALERLMIPFIGEGRLRGLFSRRVVFIYLDPVPGEVIRQDRFIAGANAGGGFILGQLQSDLRSHQEREGSQQLGIAVERPAESGPRKRLPVRHAHHALAVADLNFFVQYLINNRAQAQGPPRPPFRIARLVWLKAGGKRWPAVTDAIGLVVGSFAIPGVTDFLVFAGHSYVLRVRMRGGHSSRWLSVISSKVRPVSECIASRPVKACQRRIATST